MRKLKKFNEAEEWIYGNPGIPGQPRRQEGEEDYLSKVWARRKEQIRRQGPGIFDLQGSAQAVRGHERELELLLEKVFNNIYKGIVERHNIKFDIKFADQRSIGNMLIIRESFESEKYKRKIINLVGQGEAKNMMYVFHNEEFTQGIYDIFGETKGRQLIQMWTEIVKAVDAIDVHRKVDSPWNTSVVKNSVGGACKIEWDKNEGLNEDRDFIDNLFDEDDDEDDEDDYNYDNEETSVDDLLAKALDSGDFEKVEEIEKENSLSDNYIRNKFTPKVVARGVDFTMLIHEAIKGLYLVLSIIGLPKEKEMAKRVINSGYIIREEPEEFKWGPMIAADLRDFINESPKLTEEVLSKYPNMREEFWFKILKLESEEFLKVFRSFLNRSEEGKIKRDAILQKVITHAHNHYENKRLKAEYLAKKKKYEEDMRKYEEDMRKYEESLRKKQEKQPQSAPQPEPEAQGEPDYANMAPSELDKLMNAAMDVNDWDLVRKISQYIK